MATALCVLLMVVAIIAADVLFLRNRFWLRFAVNLGIALLFTAFYFRFLKSP
jgi:hypothetical protein